jgi:hypothetical protein
LDYIIKYFLNYISLVDIIPQRIIDEIKNSNNLIQSLENKVKETLERQYCTDDENMSSKEKELINLKIELYKKEIMKCDDKFMLLQSKMKRFLERYFNDL